MLRRLIENLPKLRHKVSNYKPGDGAKIWDHARQTYRRQALLNHVLPKQMKMVAVAAAAPPVLGVGLVHDISS